MYAILCLDMAHFNGKLVGSKTALPQQRIRYEPGQQARACT